MLTKNGKAILVLLLILLSFGLVMIYSSSYPYALDIGQDGAHFLKKQIASIAIGVVLFAIAFFVDYRFYKKFSLPIYLISFVLCLLVFTPLGNSYDTFARRWVKLPGISFMPSDFMKIAAVIFLANFLSVRKTDRLNFWWDVGPVFAIIGISILPIYLQPNMSTVITLASTMLIIYFISGLRIWYILASIPPLVILLGLSFLGEKNAYRRERIKILLNPLEDYLDSGWQLSQSLFAVASGGLFGVGLGRSAQKYLYLSEAHNDFIFAIISEELGFVGAVFTIVLFLLFLKYGLQIALETRDAFGKMLASGLTLLLVIQAFINMGVAFALLPPTGLVLPFVSYGGTSVAISMAMVGVLLNISKISKRENVDIK